MDIGSLSKETIHNDGVNNLSRGVSGFKQVAIDLQTEVYLVTDSDDLSLYATLAFTGVLTAACTIIAPNRARVYILDNRTTGAYSLTIKTSAGNGVILAQGARTLCYSDSVNIYGIGEGSSGILPIASETLAGITRYGTPAETTAGLLDTVAVHPLGLKAALTALPGPPAASTTVVGVSRFGTTTETVAGILQTVAATPAGVKAAINAIPLATTSAVGLAEAATNQESVTGLDTSRFVTPAGLQAKIDTLPVAPITGTPYSLVRIPSSGSGQQASPGLIFDATNRLGIGVASPTVALEVSGAIKASDVAGTQTNLGLGSASDVQFARLGLGRVASAAARLVFTTEATQKILLYGDALSTRNGLGIISGALQLFSQSSGRLELGGMDTADGVTFTRHMAISGSTGNVGIGTHTFGTSAQRVLAAVIGVRPTTFPPGTVQLWVENFDGIAGQAALCIASEDAVVTRIGTGLLARQAVLTTTTATEAVPLVLTAEDSGRVINAANGTAKAQVNLPPAATGLTYPFIVYLAPGLRIRAAAGDVIRIGGVGSSGTAGYAESTTLYSALILVAVNATYWMAISATGTWTVGT
jgi:hypothetical protein